MAGFLYKGILLQQLKEPALSRDLREFVNADTIGARLGSPQVSDPDELTYGEIISIARSAGIVDERDGAFLADKLLKARRRAPQLLVADAIDDEPYISSQINPLIKNQQLAADGLTLCQRACGAQQAIIAIYKNLTDLDVRIPKHIASFPVERIRGRYPAEYQASRQYAAEEGVFIVGIGALLHLARAVLFNRPQTTAFITVAGNCVGNPTNLEVSLGMTVAQVLERCGLIDDPNRVIIGGSMTGISVIDTEHTLITPTTRAVLAFRQDIKTENFQCIGCSRCVHACPVGLNPFFLHRNITRRRFAMFAECDGQMCVECGTCSYMCPAKLDLSDMIHKAGDAFAPMLSGIEKNKKQYALCQESEYTRYLENYRLGRAISAHKRALKHLLKERRKNLAAAASARHAADRGADQILANAKKTLQTQEDTADRVLGTGLNALHGAENAADQALLTALNTMRASERDAAAALTAALNTLHETERNADRVLAQALEKMRQSDGTAEQTLLAAQKAMENRQTQADKTYENACRTRESSDRGADKSVNDALKTKAQAEKDADRKLAEIEKSQDQLMQKTVQEAEKELALIKKTENPDPKVLKSAEARCKETRAQAEKARKEALKKAREENALAKKEAQAAYARFAAECEEGKNASVRSVQSALMICAQEKQTAKELFAAAKAKCADDKKAAAAEYAQAQVLCVKTKEEAKKVYAQAEVVCAQAKEEAKKVYAQAEVVCARAKEEARGVYTQVESDCAKAKLEARAVFAVCEAEHTRALEQNKKAYEELENHVMQQSHEQRLNIDKNLRNARTAAFQSAKKAGLAKAALAGRRPSLRDFEMPTYVLKSEQALQNPAGKLAAAEEEPESAGPAVLSKRSEVVLEVGALLHGWTSKITYTGQSVGSKSSGGRKI